MAKTKFVWTYAFLFLVAAFSAWVYFVEFKGGQEKEKAKESAAALLPFSNSTVTEISIRSKPASDATGALTMETIAKRTDGQWQIEKPFRDFGDPMAIENFLATVSNEKIKETVVEGPDIFWKTYGLEQPIIDAAIVSKLGEGAPVKRTIQIGSVDGFEGTVYARLDGENRVVLLSSTARAALQKDPRDLRDKHFFRRPPGDKLGDKKTPEFRTVEIARAGLPKLELVKSAAEPDNQKDLWIKKGESSDAWPLDQSIVKSYIDSFLGLRGNDVWGEDKTDPKVLKMRNLVRPGLEVRLGGNTNEKYEVKIASLEKAESVAAGFGSERPLVFSVYKPQIETLAKSIDDFRDLKFPFRFSIADVSAIELERPAGSVSLPTLIKRDGKWMIDPADTRLAGREAKSELVDRLMAEVNAFSALKMLPASTRLPKLGPKGSVRIGFFGEKKKKLAEFIFNPVGEIVLVSSSLTPGRVFQIEKALMDALTLDLEKSGP